MPSRSSLMGGLSISFHFCELSLQFLKVHLGAEWVPAVPADAIFDFGNLPIILRHLFSERAFLLHQIQEVLELLVGEIWNVTVTPRGMAFVA